MKKEFELLEVNKYSESIRPKSSIEKSLNVLLGEKDETTELFKSFGKEEDSIEKSMDTSKLVKKQVQIHAANGKVYNGYRWVSTQSGQPATTGKESKDVQDFKNKKTEPKDAHEKRGFDEGKGDEDITGKDEKLSNDSENKDNDEFSNKILEISSKQGAKKSQRIRDLAGLGVYDPSFIMQLNPDINANDVVHYLKESGVDPKKIEETLADNINTSLGNKHPDELKQSPIYQLQGELKSKELQKVLKANKIERAKKLGITGKDKFDAYRFKLDQLIGDKMTRSALIYGTGGLGKTYNAEEKLREYGLVGWDPDLDLNPNEYDYRKVTGNTSPTDLYNILYTNKDKLVIFDDADSMWEGGNEEMANMLKGVLDSTGDRMIHYGNPKAMTDGSKAPTDFKFNGQILFISNLPREKFPQPIVDSRANALDLSMTMDQTLEMLGDIKDKFKYKNAKGEEIKISPEDRNDILKVLNELKNDLRVEQVNGRTLGNLAALKSSLADKGKKDYETFKRQAIISLDLA